MEANAIKLEKQAITNSKIENSNQAAIEVGEFLGLKYSKQPYNPYVVFVIGAYFICAEPHDNKTRIHLSKRTSSFSFNTIEEYN
jgi:hypothetical protein